MPSRQILVVDDGKAALAMPVAAPTKPMLSGNKIAQAMKFAQEQRAERKRQHAEAKKQPLLPKQNAVFTSRTSVAAKAQRAAQQLQQQQYKNRRSKQLQQQQQQPSGSGLPVARSSAQLGIDRAMMELRGGAEQPQPQPRQRLEPQKRRVQLPPPDEDDEGLLGGPGAAAAAPTTTTDVQQQAMELRRKREARQAEQASAFEARRYEAAKKAQARQPAWWPRQPIPQPGSGPPKPRWRPPSPRTVAAADARLREIEIKLEAGADVTDVEMADAQAILDLKTLWKQRAEAEMAELRERFAAEYREKQEEKARLNRLPPIEASGHRASSVLARGGHEAAALMVGSSW